MLLGLVAGCSTPTPYDPRLNGTWRANREETIAAALSQDPSWTNAPPEKLEQFKNLFGHITITYSNNFATSIYKGQESFFLYRIVARGKDYVLIRPVGEGFGSGTIIRIRFVQKDKGYWVDTGRFLGLQTPEEKFDKVIPGSGSEAGAGQPPRAATNHASMPAGARR